MTFFQNFIYILIITITPITIFKLILKEYPINHKLATTLIIINVFITILLGYYFHINIYLTIIEGIIINILNYSNLVSRNFNFKSVIPALKLLAVFLLFFIVPNLPYLFVNNNMADKYANLITVIGSLILIIILILIYFKDITKYIKDFKIHFKEDLKIGLKSWYIGLIIMALSNILISILFKNITATNENLVQQMIKSTPILTLIATTLQAPIIEEITFRKTFKDLFKNSLLFIFISGLAFGSFHVIFTMNSYIDLLYIIPYGALGASFAYMYSKTNNLCVPITFHFVHNFLLTIISILL